MSVGYGGHKIGRLLSPVEIGSYLRKAQEAGEDLHACALETGLDKTGVARFLRIVDLPLEYQHMVDWGSPKNAIGFTTALELARFENANDQRVVADAILSNRFTSKEVRQIVQLKKRSERPINECVKEVVGMRTTIQTRHMFIGMILDKKVEQHLSKLTQAMRNEIIESGIDRLNLGEVTGRLGKRMFTLVGDEKFNKSMIEIGKQDLEIELRRHIEEVVFDASC